MAKIITATNVAPVDEPLGLIPSPKPLPWENTEALAAVEAAVMAQLDPQTVFEKAIAGDIVACLWEILRAGDLSHCVTVLGYRKAVTQLIGNPVEEHVLKNTPAQKLASSLTTPDERPKAIAQLSAFGIDENDIKALGYLETFHENEAQYRRRIRLEERRRELLEDYRATRAVRHAEDVEDAEVLETNDQ